MKTVCFIKVQLVELTIRTLPDLPSGAKYQCVWGSAPPSDAEVTTTGLKCRTASPKYRPEIPALEDHVLVPLSVRSSETNKDFVSRNFAFYDCTRHTTCNSCVRSSWACNWCVYENICTQNTSACMKAVISGEKNEAKLLSHGSTFCPRFWRGSSELLAANEAKTELVLLAENLPMPRTDQLGFQCVVTIEGATMVIGAEVTGPPAQNEIKGHNRTLREKGSTHSLQKVMCEPTIYRYESDVGEYEAKVTLVWNRNHVVDWKPFTIYKCDILGAHRGHQDCSLCVTRPKKFQCAWCGAACKYSPNCPGNVQPLMQTETISRIKNEPSFARQCPTPRIDVIQPLAAH
ncbi:Plexin-B [Armadillidium vulgare]|nr:Plexin-B [Armadillidium vulgare]